MISKGEIRKHIKEEKRNLSNIQIESTSKLVTDQLISSNEYRKSDIIYTYVAFNEELITNSLMEHSLSIGKKVAVPKVLNNEMNFYYIENLNELEKGFYGILEPKTNHMAISQNALIIMPGLAFDLTGNRVGYGAGYYDKYLQKRTENTYLKIAFAYEFQVFEQIEQDQYDIKVDEIITPKRWIKTGKE